MEGVQPLSGLEFGGDCTRVGPRDHERANPSLNDSHPVGMKEPAWPYRGVLAYKRSHLVFGPKFLAALRLETADQRRTPHPLIPLPWGEGNNFFGQLRNG